MRVLVIDDEPAVAGAIAEGLQVLGHDVVVAGGGEEGVECVAAQRPDLVILDVRLPDVDGVEVLRRIRASHPGLPVIVMSGWATDTILDEVRSLGVVEIVPKPTTLTRLASALAEARIGR